MGRGLIYSMLDHLTLGGEGGQCYRTGGHSQGGAGGGGIFVRGRRLKGGGAVVADGVAGEMQRTVAPAVVALGSIYLRITDDVGMWLPLGAGGNGEALAAGSRDDPGPARRRRGGRVLYEGLTRRPAYLR